MKRTKLQRVAGLLKAGKCGEAEQYVRENFPRGCGIDNGTELDTGSSANRIVLNVPYHHMDEQGYYDGWTTYRVVVKADLAWGYDMRVTGRDRNGIKGYLAELFAYELGSEAQ